MNDMLENTFELSLTGPGITISKSVDAAIAAAIAQVALGGIATPASQSSGTGNQPNVSPSASQPLSLREFLQRANSSGGIHAKILAVGRYLRDFEGRTDFSRDEIRDRFRSAGEPQPGNFPRDFQKAVRAGWIAEDPKKRGRFYVTRTGDVQIDRGFRQTTPPAAT